MPEEPSKKGDDNDYDPFKHRETKVPTSNFDAFVYLVKSSIGIGVIAMPDAFKDAGYINGVIFTAIFGLILLYMMHILLRTMYQICKRKRVPYLAYSVAMKFALQDGPPQLRCLSIIASCFVDAMITMYHFGLCCVYVVFIAESIKEVSYETESNVDLRFFMLMAALPLLIVSLITTISAIRWLSIIANVLLLFATCALLWFIITYDDSDSVRNAFGTLEAFPLFFGIVLFALEAFGVILRVDENLKHPDKYLKPFGVLNTAMVLVILVNLLIGFLGYWKYGDAVMGSITLNLPRNEILAKVTIGLFAVSFAISYALQQYVTVDVLWNRYIKIHVDDYNYRRYELTIRGFMAIITIFAAMLIPKFSHYLSLIGAFYLSILGLILPALMELCVLYPDRYGRFKYVAIRDSLIMIFGFVGGALGVYTSAFLIAERYSEDEVVSYFGSVG